MGDSFRKFEVDFEGDPKVSGAAPSRLCLTLWGTMQVEAKQTEHNGSCLHTSRKRCRNGRLVCVLNGEGGAA
jgi:hypothetical protein